MFSPFLLLPALAGPGQSAVQDRELLAMGTRLGLHLEGQGPALRLAMEDALDALEHLEAVGSTWRKDTEWSRLNQADSAWVPLSAEGFQLLARARHWQQESGGAFDPVIGALIEAWGLRQGGRIPSFEDRDRALAASGARWLELDEATQAARLKHPGARIEEGGFLKGAALDALRKAAQTRGAQSGLLDFGGQLLCWGRPRLVEVAAPGARHRGRLKLRLAEASLSSSGCSERGRHLLDPRTGQPAPDWGVVAVVMPTGLDADAVSTALFVMGPTQGLAWAEAHGVAACFLPHQGPCRMSAAFRALHPHVLKEPK